MSAREGKLKAFIGQNNTTTKIDEIENFTENHFSCVRELEPATFLNKRSNKMIQTLLPRQQRPSWLGRRRQTSPPAGEKPAHEEQDRRNQNRQQKLPTTLLVLLIKLLHRWTRLLQEPFVCFPHRNYQTTQFVTFNQIHDCCLLGGGGIKK